MYGKHEDFGDGVKHLSLSENLGGLTEMDNSTRVALYELVGFANIENKTTCFKYFTKEGIDL